MFTNYFMPTGDNSLLIKMSPSVLLVYIFFFCVILCSAPQAPAQHVTHAPWSVEAIWFLNIFQTRQPCRSFFYLCAFCSVTPYIPVQFHGFYFFGCFSFARESLRLESWNHFQSKNYPCFNVNIGKHIMSRSDTNYTMFS